MTQFKILFKPGLTDLRDIDIDAFYEAAGCRRDAPSGFHERGGVITMYWGGGAIPLNSSVTAESVAEALSGYPVDRVEVVD